MRYLAVFLMVLLAWPAMAGDRGATETVDLGGGVVLVLPQVHLARSEAERSNCTCAPGRWIIIGESASYERCRSLYRNAKLQGAELGRYRDSTGDCYVCYRGDVECPESGAGDSRDVDDGSAGSAGKGRAAPGCPTRRCGGPYSASRPKCLAYNNGNGACPPGYHSKNRYGCCQGW